MVLNLLQARCKCTWPWRRGCKSSVFEQSATLNWKLALYQQKQNVKPDQPGINGCFTSVQISITVLVPLAFMNIFSVFLKGPILLKTWTGESNVTPSKIFDVAPGAACILETPHVARLVGCGNAGQAVRHPHEDDSVGVRPRRACHFVHLLGEGVEPHRFRQACLNRGTESSGWSLLQFHMRISRSSVRIPLRRSRVAQAHVLVSLDGERS